MFDIVPSIGQKSFDNFRLPQANCDKYFLKFHFSDESIYSIFWSFSLHAQCNKEKQAILFRVNKEKQAILFRVISNINLESTKKSKLFYLELFLI